MNLKYIVSIALLFFMMQQPLMANEIESDKQKHFAATTAISMVVTGYARNKGYTKVESFFWGFGTAMAVGLIKEGIDSNADTDDLKADALGGITGALISAQFEWKF